MSRLLKWLSAPVKGIAPWLAMALCVAGVLSCGSRDVAAESLPLVHNEACDVWCDSIDMHNGVVILAVNDSALQVRANGNVIRAIDLPALSFKDGADIVFTSDFPIVNALFRLENARKKRNGWSMLAPYEIYANPFDTEYAVKLLETRIKNNIVVPTESRRYYWPVVNDNAEWLFAAAGVWRVSGSKAWRERVLRVAGNVVRQDCRVARNCATGLFCGLPRYMSTGDVGYPSWLDPSLLCQVQTLNVNVLYHDALSAVYDMQREMELVGKTSRHGIPDMNLDSLRTAIVRELWMPASGRFAAMLYGPALWPVQLQVSDNIAQSMAVLAGVASRPMADAIVRRTEARPSGITWTSHLPCGWGENSDKDVAARALWAVVAAKSGNETVAADAAGTVLAASAASLLAMEPANLPHFSNPVTALVLRGWFGMEFTSGGIRFSPSVPGMLTGEKRICNVKYRGGILDITLKGTGRDIAEFYVNGVPASPFFKIPDGGGKGAHYRIDIVMKGSESDAGKRAGLSASRELPAEPVVEWTGNREAAVFTGISSGYAQNNGIRQDNVTYAYVNGILFDEVTKIGYTFPDDGKTLSVQFVAAGSDGIAGFSGAPHLIVPPENVWRIPLSDYARVGTKVLADEKLAKTFIESDRARNRNIRFEFDAPESGEYLVEVHYMSGLGIVNPRRRTALRQFRVDGNDCGVFVLPQRSAALQHRYGDTDWQSVTAMSNGLKTRLDKGLHRMELRLYQPSPVYVDPTTNTFLADYVRIVKL